MNQANFSIGQIIKHKIFNYHGVIYDVDSIFMANEEWYETMALSRPPKDKPWYYVLVNEHKTETYVAERNLEPCDEFIEIVHPLITEYFSGHNNKHYTCKSVAF